MYSNLSLQREKVDNTKGTLKPLEHVANLEPKVYFTKLKIRIDNINHRQIIEKFRRTTRISSFHFVGQALRVVNPDHTQSVLEGSRESPRARSHLRLVKSSDVYQSARRA